MGQYLIRVEGRLSDELVGSFPTLASSPRQQTVLHGAITDQKSLAALLEHLRSIGVDVLDVHRVGMPSVDMSGTDRGQSGTSIESPM